MTCNTQDIPKQPNLTETQDIAPVSPNVSTSVQDLVHNPWPNERDRASWNEYRLTPQGEGLPPYDEASDRLKEVWYGLERLTAGDIAATCEEFIEKMEGTSNAL